MKRQSTLQLKEQEKFPERANNETELSLPDPDFKKVVIQLLEIKKDKEEELGRPGALASRIKFLLREIPP